MDQKRADTLRDLVLGRTAAGTPARGLRVQLLVPQATADGTSDAPGELAGYGPIPAIAVPRPARGPVHLCRPGHRRPARSRHPRTRHRRPPRAPVPVRRAVALGERRAPDLPLPRLQPPRDRLRVRPPRAVQRPQHRDRQPANRSVCGITTASTTPAGKSPAMRDGVTWWISPTTAAVRQTARRVACRRSVAGPAVSWVQEHRMAWSILVGQD